MVIPDDFNPNMPEPIERICPECGFDGDENARLRDVLVKARRAMIVSVTGVSDGLTIHDVREWIAEADAILGDRQPPEKRNL